MNTSAEGIAFIKGFEKCSLKAYFGPDRIWTIGWGHTGPEVKPMTVWTQERCDQQFERDLAIFERDVTELVTVPLTQGQFDALVSFAYNVGPDMDGDKIAEGLGDSTLLKKLNAGDYHGAADEFGKWVKCNGVILMGLVKRRAGERAMFCEGL